MALLCMKSFCIAYEVLRQQMHQFLEGRLAQDDVLDLKETQGRVNVLP